MSTETVRDPAVYYSVIEGKFRTTVDSTHPQAVRRTYEKDGIEATKYERIVESLTGFIIDVGVYEKTLPGDKKIKEVAIKLDPNGEGKSPIIKLGVDTAFGEDFLHKLPGINFRKEITIRPYAFIPSDTGKPKRGVVITQGEETIKSYFHVTDSKEVLHGYPVPEGDPDTYESDDWKIHFMRVRKFLLTYFAEKTLHRFNEEKHLPKIREIGGGEDVTEAEAKDTFGPLPTYPEEEINPEDIPF